MADSGGRGEAGDLGEMMRLTTWRHLSTPKVNPQEI